MTLKRNKDPLHMAGISILVQSFSKLLSLLTNSHVTQYILHLEVLASQDGNCILHLNFSGDVSAKQI